MYKIRLTFVLGLHLYLPQKRIEKGAVALKRILIALCILCLFLCGCSTSFSTGTLGSIPEKPPVSPRVEYRTLRIDENPSVYTYADMEKDLETLKFAYKDLVTLEIIGSTADGRGIYDMVVGAPDAPNHVIVHGSIHAREYITTKLIMKQLAYYLKCLSDGTGMYKGVPYSELFRDVALHIVPMVNPDGVTLCQYGPEGLRTEAVRQTVLQITLMDGYTNFTQWKANAGGVDLNRNFDALWSEYAGTPHPSSDLYKGTSPGSEPETRALISITATNPVKRTISYHTYGQVIYWYFAQTGTLYEDSLAFAQEMSGITGYPPDANFTQLDPAGYKDWAIQTLGIPSITIEVGYGQNPVPDSQFETIWNENKEVWAGMLYTLKF